jgi:hypothetical protein
MTKRDVCAGLVRDLFGFYSGALIANGDVRAGESQALRVGYDTGDRCPVGSLRENGTR